MNSIYDKFHIFDIIKFTNILRIFLKGLDNIERKTIDKEQFQNITKSIGKKTFPSISKYSYSDVCVYTFIANNMKHIIALNKQVQEKNTFKGGMMHTNYILRILGSLKYHFGNMISY